MNSYRCVFLMGVERALEYRVSFFLSMLSAVFPMILQTTMWNYLYGHSDAAAIFGYEQEQILMYTLLAVIVSQLVSTGFEGEMNEDIKMGGLNKYLLRPVRYKWYQFFRFLGQKIPRLMIIAPVMVIIIGAAFWLGLHLSMQRVFAFLLSLMLAIALNFSIFYCIGLLGFWLTDVDKLFGTVQIVLTVASGGVFPLDIFGKLAELMVKLLPFGYTTQFPVNIINGRFGWEQIWSGFAFQFGWIIFFAALGSFMWKHGMKRYASVGG